jgi:hypothetical protein
MSRAVEWEFRNRRDGRVVRLMLRRQLHDALLDHFDKGKEPPNDDLRLELRDVLDGIPPPIPGGQGLPVSKAPNGAVQSKGRRDGHKVDRTWMSREDVEGHVGREWADKILDTLTPEEIDGEDYYDQVEVLQAILHGEHPREDTDLSPELADRLERFTDDLTHYAGEGVLRTKRHPRKGTFGW